MRQVSRVQVVAKHIVRIRVLVREHMRVLGVVAVQRVGTNHSQHDSNTQSPRHSGGRIHNREEHQQPGESSCKNRNVHSNNCKLTATDINHNRCGETRSLLPTEPLSVLMSTGRCQIRNQPPSSVVRIESRSLYTYDTALEVDIKGKQTLLDQPHTTSERVSQQGA